MMTDTPSRIMISLIIIIITYAIIYNYFGTSRPSVLLINECLTANITKTSKNQSTTELMNNLIDKETKRTTNNSFFELMAKDPEAHTCYALQSPAMPEEIIDLNAVAINHQRIGVADAPAEVKFDKVHSILYGDPEKQSIYQSAEKYFKKNSDHSYPHTALKKDIFISIIQKLQPNLKLQFVVEVGSFTGNSAVVMGNVLKETYSESFLLCIDTWLGDLNMWVNKIVWGHLAVTEDGRPTVYYQFLANIVAANLTKTVLPVSMSSVLGARFLRSYQFRPQIIYLDSAHEQGETLIELALYWNMLRVGGVLFGDDWNWDSVRCDVKKFAYMRNLTIERSGVIWVLKKLTDP